MAKISKAFLGTLLATSGWFQNKNHRHSPCRMDEWTVTSPLVRLGGPVQFKYFPDRSVYSTLILDSAAAQNRNLVREFTARDVTLCSSLFYFFICLAYANDNFKVASCNDDSAVSMKFLFLMDRKQKFIIIILRKEDLN